MSHVDRRRRTSGCSAAVALAVLLGVLTAPVVAVAHPGGGLMPPHARFSADDEVVTIEWTAPPDDAAHIGEAVGILPAGTMEAFLIGPPEALPTDDEVRALAASAELERYLLDHVEVRQDGRRCDGAVTPSPAFLDAGAVFTFRCPERVAEVDVRITILQDQDPRYDTFGVDGTVWTVLFTAAQPEHRWDATAAAGDEPTVPLALLAAAGVLALLLGAWLVLLPRLRRVRRGPRTYGVTGVRRRARRSRSARRRSRPPVRVP